MVFNTIYIYVGHSFSLNKFF